MHDIIEKKAESFQGIDLKKKQISKDVEAGMLHESHEVMANVDRF